MRHVALPLYTHPAVRCGQNIDLSPNLFTCSRAWLDSNTLADNWYPVCLCVVVSGERPCFQYRRSRSRDGCPSDQWTEIRFLCGAREARNKWYVWDTLSLSHLLKVRTNPWDACLYIYLPTTYHVENHSYITPAGFPSTDHYIIPLSPYGHTDRTSPFMFSPWI